MTLIRKTVMPTQLSAVCSLSTIEYYYNMQTYAKNSEVNYICNNNNNTSKNIIQVSVPIIFCKINYVIIVGLDTFIETSKLNFFF